MPPPPPAPIRFLRRHLRRYVLRSYSSSWQPQQGEANCAKPKWNSNHNLVITHPVLSLMESCDSMDRLKQLHAHMTRTGLMSHRFPASRVVAFCALSDHGDMSHAASVFEHFSEPNTYMWNTMIRGYARSGNPVAATACFRRMLREHAEMDNRTLVFAIKCCERFPTGEGVHGVAVKLAFERDLLVQNGLMHFYVARGMLVAAQKVFDEACQRDVVSWTTIIDGYTQKGGSPDEALRLFYRMLSRGVEPNVVTMITVLSAVSQLGMLRLGILVHNYIKCSGINLNIKLLNALIDMYGKCGCIDRAEQVFNSMHVKDVFSWTSIINAYAKCDDLDSARQFFDAMPERNAVSWSCMIAAYSQANCPKKAINLFHEMIAGNVRPIDATLVAVLSACAQSGFLDLGRQIYNYFVDGPITNLRVNLANAFIDMYSKCGDITTAANLFNQMIERDIVTWNTMMLAYAIHGYSKEALALFEQMKELRFVPDEITFVGVLSACGHGGLVAEGQRHFEDMKYVFKLTPRAIHYACLIDLLGKAGLMEDAYKLVRNMPIKLDEAGWGALLNASRIHGNIDIGTFAGEKLLDLDPDDSGIYVLISNMCASRNKWDNVKKVRKMMRDRGVKKNPGCSLLEVDGKFHEFFAADTSHAHSEEIYLILDAIYLHLKMEGYDDRTQC